MYALQPTLQDKLARCQWQAGDVLVLDNLRYQHGRLPYSGERKMAVVLGDPLVRANPADANPSAEQVWIDHLEREEQEDDSV